MGDLTTNFSRSEFECPCCHQLPNEVWGFRRLYTALQDLRDLVGEPVYVTSGFRCPQRNREVGGAKNSYHLRGWAADIYVDKMIPETLKELAEVIPEFQNGGIGIYKTFIHVDVRASGPARWVG